jgi:dihydroflavonol-4-reductase
MILVTGATGLLGSHLIGQLLQENEVVRALYRSEKQLDHTRKVLTYKKLGHLYKKIQWVKGDILDIPSLEKAFEEITHVYHCAALVSFDPKDSKLLKKINIEGTANIVNCCIDFKIKKLCYVSTIAALGEPKENEIYITEKSEWDIEKNHSDYALTKYAGEMEVWRGAQEGLKVAIVNPGVIFGYGFANLGSDLFIKWVKDKTPFYTVGNIGIVAVEDVVFSLVNLMKASISGEKFIIVGENTTYKALFFCIADLLNSKRPFIKAPRLLTEIVWRIDWFFSLFTHRKRKLTKATADASHAKYLFDTSKIEKAIDITFSKKEVFLKAILESEQPDNQ